MEDNSIFVFVLMPFDPDFDDIYKFGIKEAASQLNIIAERVDEQLFSGGILERIYRQIDLADIVIADMTGQNPNVFYEVGYAHAKGKLTIHITRNISDIPFDLKNRRHIIYHNSINTLRDRLIEELTWAKDEIQNIQKSHIKVTLKNIYGNLERSKFFAKGDIKFTIDFF